MVLLLCTKQTFRPATFDRVRWLQPDADYRLAAAFWDENNGPLSWRSSGEAHSVYGYRYAALIQGDAIIAVAAALPFSSAAYELSAVMTARACRRCGHGRSVASFVTAFILETADLATCQTREDKQPMIRLAESVGFTTASPTQARRVAETQHRYFERAEETASTESAS